MGLGSWGLGCTKRLTLRAYSPVLHTLARLKPTMTLEEGMRQAMQEWQQSESGSWAMGDMVGWVVGDGQAPGQDLAEVLAIREDARGGWHLTPPVP